MKKKVCVIPGDDAMPEAVDPTVDLLEGMNLGLEFTRLPGGDEADRIYGKAPLTELPPEIKKAIDESDATLFGSTASHNYSVAALIYFRWAADGLDCGCHLRPIKYLKGARAGVRDPEGIDWLCIREGREGLYVKMEGKLKDLAPLSNILKPGFGTKIDWQGTGTFAIRVVTEENTLKIARFACDLARKRKAKGYPGKITCVEKYNMLTVTGELFRKTCENVVKKEYPDLKYEEFILDDFARRLVERAKSLDVVILSNENADVLSDAAAATVGGLGFGYSGCYGDKYAYFEPSAGSFPRAKGLNIINPTGTLLSAVLMLEYLGLEKGADRLQKAIEAVYADQKVIMQDQGGNATTTQFFDALKTKL